MHITVPKALWLGFVWVYGRNRLKCVRLKPKIKHKARSIYWYWYWPLRIWARTHSFSSVLSFFFQQKNWFFRKGFFHLCVLISFDSLHSETWREFFYPIRFFIVPFLSRSYSSVRLSWSKNQRDNTNRPKKMIRKNVSLLLPIISRDILCSVLLLLPISAS